MFISLCIYFYLYKDINKQETLKNNLCAEVFRGRKCVDCYIFLFLSLQKLTDRYLIKRKWGQDNYKIEVLVFTDAMFVSP